MIFLPDNIKIHGKVKNYNVETVDTRVVYSADSNERVRSGGEPTYKLLNFTIDMTNAEFATFLTWFEANNLNAFYALFPDLDFPNIDVTKYYCFRFNTTQLTYNKRGRYGYNVVLQLQWYYFVPPTEKV